MKKIIAGLFLATVLFLSQSGGVMAQEKTQINTAKQETLEATVVRILQEKEIMPPGGINKQLYQKLEMKVDSGSLKGETIVVENGNLPAASVQRYKEGDVLVVTDSKGVKGSEFYITDYVRRGALIWLFVIFVVVVVLVGRWYGITSLLGMGFSFIIIFRFIIPQIFEGGEPVTIAILGSLMIVPVTFYLSHGLNKKTTVSIIGTVASLILTGIIAQLFIGWGKFTGLASEEANYVQVFYQGTVNIKGLLLAGIIISGVGVFDDVTVSQAALIAQLKQTSSKLGFRQLFEKAMEVGHDHIASCVNTLVLVYAGAALPLLILFVGNPRPFSEIINYEFIAEEVVKTLVASIGLVMAVPITSVLAAWVYRKEG